MSKYVIIDLEMCKAPRGIKDEKIKLGNELIEIGAVMLDENYDEIDSFKTFVSPEYGEVDYYIQKLTGISKEDTVNAPPAKEALEAFAAWLPDDAVLVSWSDSDERQLCKEIEFKNLDIPKLKKHMETWEDCQKTFSEKMDSPKVYKLSEALIIADIDFDENLHDALVDAKNTAMLFAKMKREPKLKLISCYMTEDEDDTSSLNMPIAGLLEDFSCTV